MRAIANAAVKTDQIDASTLAHLAHMNYIPKSYAAPQEIRDLRQLLRHREWIVNQRSKAKNRIHAVLAAYNLVSPVTDLFGVAGRGYLHEMMEKDIRPAASQVITDHLAMIDHLTEHIQAIERSISLSEKQDHIVNLLRSMPGVGSAPTFHYVQLNAYFERLISLNPEIMQRTRSKPNLIQSIQSQNHPPHTRSGDEPYSSAYTPIFQNNFKEITKEIKLKTKITMSSSLFSRFTSFPVFLK
ncbi:MAG TPA: hypothetical protein DCK95_10310 [Anaerolineaceae bacterium]|nr:hypothetical protein [Anaerolineaceae bacterium]